MQEESVLVEPEKKSIKQLIWEHVEYSMNIASMHGLIHVISSKRSWAERDLDKFCKYVIRNRLIWIILVIGAVTITVIQTLQVWQHYQTRPVVISLEIDNSMWKAPFPSVTVCYKSLSEKYESLIEPLMQKYNIDPQDEDFGKYLNDLVFGNYFNYKNFEIYANGSRKDYLPTSEYMDVISKVPNRVNGTKKRISRLKTVLHPFNVERPIVYVFTEIGPCSIYNSEVGVYFEPDNLNKMNITNTYKPIEFDITKQPLPSFRINAIPSEYTLYLSSSNEMIDITTKSIFAESGTYQLMDFLVESVLTSADVEDLTINQRNCRYIQESENLKHAPIYTHNLCRIECRIRLCMKFCNCTPHYYRRLENEPICDMTGLYCLSKHSDEIVHLHDPTTKQDICPCLQTCIYHNPIIASDEIHDIFVDTFFQITMQRFPDIRYKMNLIFSKSDVLVQIGGLYGLFLGCSILSIIEILYFFTLRFFWAVFGGRNIPINSGE